MLVLKLLHKSVPLISLLLFIDSALYNYPPAPLFLSYTSMYPAGGISATIYANRLRAEGMGSKENAVLFANQDFEALKQQCVESGCLFEDPSFPAEPPSLGFKELAPYSSKTRDVEWMRPTVRDRELTMRIFRDLLMTCYKSSRPSYLIS